MRMHGYNDVKKKQKSFVWHKLELDPYGGAGPDGIFSLFFIKTADFF